MILKKNDYKVLRSNIPQQLLCSVFLRLMSIEKKNEKKNEFQNIRYENMFLGP